VVDSAAYGLVRDREQARGEIDDPDMMLGLVMKMAFGDVVDRYKQAANDMFVELERNLAPFHRTLDHQTFNMNSSQGTRVLEKVALVLMAKQAGMSFEDEEGWLSAMSDNGIFDWLGARYGEPDDHVIIVIPPGGSGNQVNYGDTTMPGGGIVVKRPDSWYDNYTTGQGDAGDDGATPVIRNVEDALGRILDKLASLPSIYPEALDNTTNVDAMLGSYDYTPPVDLDGLVALGLITPNQRVLLKKKVFTKESEIVRTLAAIEGIYTTSGVVVPSLQILSARAVVADMISEADDDAEGAFFNSENLIGEIPEPARLFVTYQLDLDVMDAMAANNPGEALPSSSEYMASILENAVRTRNFWEGLGDLPEDISRQTFTGRMLTAARTAEVFQDENGEMLTFERLYRRIGLDYAEDFESFIADITESPGGVYDSLADLKAEIYPEGVENPPTFGSVLNPDTPEVEFFRSVLNRASTFPNAAPELLGLTDVSYSALFVTPTATADLESLAVSATSMGQVAQLVGSIGSISETSMATLPSLEAESSISASAEFMASLASLLAL